MKTKSEFKTKVKTNTNKDRDLVVNNVKEHVENYRLRKSKENDTIISKGDIYKILASKVGMTDNGVQQLLKGYSLPSILTALRLSKELEVSVNDLFILKTDEEINEE